MRYINIFILLSLLLIQTSYALFSELLSCLLLIFFLLNNPFHPLELVLLLCVNYASLNLYYSLVVGTDGRNGAIISPATHRFQPSSSSSCSSSSSISASYIMQYSISLASPTPNEYINLIILPVISTRPGREITGRIMKNLAPRPDHQCIGEILPVSLDVKSAVNQTTVCNHADTLSNCNVANAATWDTRQSSRTQAKKSVP